MASTSHDVEDAQSDFYGGNSLNVDSSASQGFGRTTGTGASGAVEGGTGYASRAGLTRAAPTEALGYGRGPRGVDPRRYRYDRVRAATMPKIEIQVNRVDRLTAEEAGAMLHRVHEIFQLETQTENVIAAFDRALWLDHALNGASQMQPGRGVLVVGDTSFDTMDIRSVLGVDLRRFFRAFADDVADELRRVLKEHDPYDHASEDLVGQIRQIAAERGLQKYPHLIHDSSDACVSISLEERTAVMQSKTTVLTDVVNAVDGVRPRPGPGRVVTDGT